jgi:hypothetical protein
MTAKKRKLPPALAAHLFAKGGGRVGDAKKPAAKPKPKPKPAAKPKPKPKPAAKKAVPKKKSPRR